VQSLTEQTGSLGKSAPGDLSKSWTSISRGDAWGAIDIGSGLEPHPSPSVLEFFLWYNCRRCHHEEFPIKRDKNQIV
jgi:hypothetical protein